MFYTGGMTATWVEAGVGNTAAPELDDALWRAWLAHAWTLEPEPSVLEDEPELDLWQLDDRGLLAELDAARSELARAQGRWLAVLAEADRRQVFDREHGMPVGSWLAAGTTHSARSALTDVRLGALLVEHASVGGALAAGAISREQAEAITFGLDHLPDDLDPTAKAAVAEHLVELAAEFNPTALRRLVNRAVEVVAPEVAEAADRTALERAERAQQRSRFLAFRTDPDDGGLRFHGKLPALEGELFRQHLTALAVASRTADATAGIDTSQGQALADALALAVGHHADCTGGPVRGGDATRVLVSLDHHTLLDGLGAATLVECDAPITGQQVRHLACTAGLIPLVFDGDPLPLDLGRTQRFFSPAQRHALALRDRGCIFPGCDRPPADTQTHHATLPWHAGGATDLSDGVLLCPHHHHLLEPDPRKPDHENWQITFDERGLPQVHSPVHRDGRRITRQHHRFRC